MDEQHFQPIVEAFQDATTPLAEVNSFLRAYAEPTTGVIDESQTDALADVVDT